MVLYKPAVLVLLLCRFRARQEDSAAPFGLWLTMEIKLCWGLMPGQFLP